MIKLLCVSTVTLLSVLSMPAQADDNVAACEIVLMAPIFSPEMKAEAENEAKAETETEVKTEPKIEPETETKTETEAKMDAAVKTEAKIDMKAHADHQEPAPMIATFLPADDFIFSVFDGTPGHMESVDGKTIRALMCTRSNVLPTEFDAKLIQTGIQLHLSQNFNSAKSALLSVYKQDGDYVHQYAGPDLNQEDVATLKTYLKKLNTRDED